MNNVARDKSTQNAGAARPAREPVPATELTRTLRLEQRSDGRQTIGAVGCTPLWVSCKGGAMGGQVTVRDFSRRGIGVVATPAAARLIVALQEAQTSGALVDLSWIPGATERKARVVWNHAAELRELRFGLESTEPLGDWLKSAVR